MEYIKRVIPNCRSLRLLYSGERDGWTADQFHRLCDDQGRTLTLILSKKLYLAGGYASIPWKSTEDDQIVKDEEAFVFSLTNRMKIFKPEDPDEAIVHHKHRGPYFGNSLGVSVRMNAELNGTCETIFSQNDNARYKVHVNGNGNSVLTGMGGQKNNGNFTCTGIEVYLIE